MNWTSSRRALRQSRRTFEFFDRYFAETDDKTLLEQQESTSQSSI